MAPRVVGSDPPHVLGSIDGPLAGGGLAPALLNLPSLDPSELSPLNISLARAVYTATLMEEIQVFAVADRLTELLAAGRLTAATDFTAGSRVERDEAPHRMSLNERRDVYARVLGSAGARARSRPNSEFYRLFVGFVSEVQARFGAPGTRSNRRRPTDAADARRLCRAARELAQNLSLHAAGTQLLVSQLTKLLQEAMSLASDPLIMQAYAAAGTWDLIEKVAQAELGSRRNPAALRALAEAGSRILDWLSQSTFRIQRCEEQPLLEVRLLRAGVRAARPGSVSDTTLIEACRDWLAAAATLGLALN
jgi:hypothetical protein